MIFNTFFALLKSCIILLYFGGKRLTARSMIDEALRRVFLIGQGVLRTRKDINRVYYRVGDGRTLTVLGMMREVFCGILK